MKNSKWWCVVSMARVRQRKESKFAMMEARICVCRSLMGTRKKGVCGRSQRGRGFMNVVSACDGGGGGCYMRFV
jgi:hypothetical protein